jgi:hypothetical protein
MLLKNMLKELRNLLSIILRDSTNLREVLTPFATFLGGPLTRKKENWRIAVSVVKPSRRFYESSRRFAMKCISTSIGCQKLKDPL